MSYRLHRGLTNGSGTWSREARRVTLLASELGMALDSEALILCDVRDLMGLRLRLRAELARTGRHNRL
ncbi:MAG TPA: hypothetical protein VFE42_19625 [Chloroflexota bacterium]|nr:hypothetical protein [Chloroflexota bacterium]